MPKDMTEEDWFAPVVGLLGIAGMFLGSMLFTPPNNNSSNNNNSTLPPPPTNQKPSAGCGCQGNKG